MSKNNSVFWYNGMLLLFFDFRWVKYYWQFNFSNQFHWCLYWVKHLWNYILSVFAIFVCTSPYLQITSLWEASLWQNCMDIGKLKKLGEIFIIDCLLLVSNFWWAYEKNNNNNNSQHLQRPSLSSQLFQNNFHLV